MNVYIYIYKKEKERKTEIHKFFYVLPFRLVCFKCCVVVVAGVGDQQMFRRVPEKTCLFHRINIVHAAATLYFESILPTIQHNHAMGHRPRRRPWARGGGRGGGGWGGGHIRI